MTHFDENISTCSVKTIHCLEYNEIKLIKLAKP